MKELGDVHCLAYLEATWECHGIPMGDPWETHGRPMGDPRETHGRPMGDPWATRGPALQAHGK